LFDEQIRNLQNQQFPILEKFQKYGSFQMEVTKNGNYQKLKITQN